MLKLFQFIVWALSIWLAIDLQIEQGYGVDLLASFMFGGLLAYWATGFLILFRIMTTRVTALARRALRRLFLFKQPHQPTHRLIAQERRRALQ